MNNNEFQIEQPRKPNKYVEFFGSYIALPLMLVILVLSLILLFVLVKAYFSNSYMYAFQDNLDNKYTNNLNIGAIVDSRYDQFNYNSKLNTNKINNNNKELYSLIEKTLLNKKQLIQTQNSYSKNSKIVDESKDE